MSTHRLRNFARAPVSLAAIVVALAVGPLLLATYSVLDVYAGPGAKTERLAVYFLVEAVALVAAGAVKHVLEESVASHADGSARRRARRALTLAALVWWLALAIELLLPVAIVFGFLLSMGVAG